MAQPPTRPQWFIVRHDQPFHGSFVLHVVKPSSHRFPSQAATVDGVLGGFPETSEPDLRESRWEGKLGFVWWGTPKIFEKWWFVKFIKSCSVNKLAICWGYSPRLLQNHYPKVFLAASLNGSLADPRRFLDLLFRSPHPPDRGTVLDCGAGIGRAGKHSGRKEVGLSKIQKMGDGGQKWLGNNEDGGIDWQFKWHSLHGKFSISEIGEIPYIHHGFWCFIWGEGIDSTEIRSIWDSDPVIQLPLPSGDTGYLGILPLWIFSEIQSESAKVVTVGYRGLLDIPLQFDGWNYPLVMSNIAIENGQL